MQCPVPFLLSPLFLLVQQTFDLQKASISPTSLTPLPIAMPPMSATGIIMEDLRETWTASHMVGAGSYLSTIRTRDRRGMQEMEMYHPNVMAFEGITMAIYHTLVNTTDHSIHMPCTLAYSLHMLHPHPLHIINTCATILTSSLTRQLHLGA
jgi:hypothetical protein